MAYSGLFYTVPEQLPWEVLSPALVAATEGMARLDERQRGRSVAAGWACRQHYHEACASLGLEGELIHLDDLLLRDASMGTKISSQPLQRAGEVLRARRLITQASSAWATTDLGVQTLRNRVAATGEGGERPGILDYGDDPEREAQAFLRWRRVVRETEALPGLLAATIGYDAWTMLDPFPRDRWLGPQLVASGLQRRGCARHHLPAICRGLRAVDAGRWPAASLELRLSRILEALAAASTLGLKEFDRLSLVEEMMHRALAGHRSSSHLPGLIALFVELPVVSVPLAARKLGITPQSTMALMAKLQGHIRELTERRRYRAWTVS